METTLNAEEWRAFIADAPARADAAARWEALRPKLEESVRLVGERWTTDDPWPGVLVGGPREACETRAIDVETWAFVRAVTSGVGLAALRERASREE